MKGESMGQSRWKSPVLWGAIIALVLGVLIDVGVLSISQQEQVNTVVSKVLELLVLFGILNDPTNKIGF
jgi:uncharacterized membrane protein